MAGLALELGLLFALLDLPVGLQSGKGLVPREGGKEEGGRGTTGGDLACGGGQAARRSCSPLLAT